MKQMVFPIFTLALIAHTCSSAIVVPTPESKHLTRLHKAVIDVVMTCYGDPGNAVGIVGDSDGSILKALWSNYSIPVILVDTMMTMDNAVTYTNQHRLQVVVVAAESTDRFFELMTELLFSIWWNHYANFLIVSSTPNIVQQCSDIVQYLYIAYENFGVLRAQFICIDRTMNVHIFNFNPYTRKAPVPWQFLRSYKTMPTPFSLFKLVYREGGETCDVLNFEKTNDLGGFPVRIMIPPGLIHEKIIGFVDEWSKNIKNPTSKKLIDLFFQQDLWFIDNIVIGLNASIIISNDTHAVGIIGISDAVFNMDSFIHDRVIYTWDQRALLAVTQHTAHKSQLEKILTVIDRESRIGMWIVYLITFLFFKFFLRQPIIPALLNLVRLTCNTGLTKLPLNFAPTIYLACLFMFVVTLQAIYTGDLASLLTTVVAYPHVNTMQDIVDLGYKIHAPKFAKNLLAADPILDGHVIKVAAGRSCIDNVLHDPLAVCVTDYKNAVIMAYDKKLHLSRDIIKRDHTFYVVSACNPLGRKLKARIRTWDECSLRPPANRIFAMIHGSLVNDDDVNKNVVRRVMKMDDLMFAFVILAVGMTCSFVCFIGEIVIHRISLRLARRRDRVLPRSAWEITENKSLSFSALKLRFNALRLFSKRRQT